MRVFLTGRLYAPEGTGGGGAEGTGGGGEHPVAPWAAANGGMWRVGEGDKARDWYETIPEGPVRDHVKAKGYTNPFELANGNYNLTKLQTGSSDVIAVPGKDAKPEDWGAFYTKLGRPESADKYDLKFGEGVKTDERVVKFGKELFFELGVPAGKAQAAADKWNAFTAEVEAQELAAAQKANETALAALETKWGQDLGANKAAGERVVRALKLSEESMNAIESAIGAAPLVELLATIGRKSDEGSFFDGGGNKDPNDPNNMTKDAATARIAQLQGDAEFNKKYLDKAHPGHAEAVQTMLKLQERSSRP